MVKQKTIVSKFLEATKQSQYQGKWWSDEAWVAILTHCFYMVESMAIDRRSFNKAISRNETHLSRIDSLDATNESGVYRIWNVVTSDKGESPTVSSCAFNSWWEALWAAESLSVEIVQRQPIQDQRTRYEMLIREWNQDHYVRNISSQSSDRQPYGPAFIYS